MSNMKTFIIGNWKMHFTVGEASLFLNRLLSKIHPSRDIQVVVAPSTIALQPLSLQIDRRRIKLASQNVCPNDYGAYTGEVSVAQLKAIVDYSIVGHSERRNLYGETDKDVRDKVEACVRAGISPIVCIGETSEQRKEGETADVIRDQLLTALSNITEEDFDKIIIAYEPVWAISSNKGAKLATPMDIEKVISLIRSTIEKTYSKETSEKVIILYGGSVNTSNAEAYLRVPGVNGLLIGGASLISSEFNAIIEIAKNVSDEKH